MPKILDDYNTVLRLYRKNLSLLNGGAVSTDNMLRVVVVLGERIQQGYELCPTSAAKQRLADLSAEASMLLVTAGIPCGNCPIEELKRAVMERTLAGGYNLLPFLEQAAGLLSEVLDNCRVSANLVEYLHEKITYAKSSAEQAQKAAVSANAARLTISETAPN